MDRALIDRVWKRAQNRCEYCQLDSELVTAEFEIDHILAEKHAGQTIAANLALSCFRCNSYKGPNVAGVDPHTGRITRLFNPRKDQWVKHFVWSGPILFGVTSIGRATTEVLRMNEPWAVNLRKALIVSGLFPPTV